MEWDRNPLLREEIARTPLRQSSLAQSYAWTHGGGLAVVSWRGHTVGTVWENGTWRLAWRDRVHAGKAASQAQAIRHMSRWLAARGTRTPLTPGQTSATRGPGSLADFLRDHADGDF